MWVFGVWVEDIVWISIFFLSDFPVMENFFGQIPISFGFFYAAIRYPLFRMQVFCFWFWFPFLFFFSDFPVMEVFLAKFQIVLRFSMLLLGVPLFMMQVFVYGFDWSGRGSWSWESEAQEDGEPYWMLFWRRWTALGSWVHAKWYFVQASLSLYYSIFSYSTLFAIIKSV